MKSEIEACLAKYHCKGCVGNDMKWSEIPQNEKVVAKLEQLMAGAELNGMMLVNECHGCVDCSEDLTAHKAELERLSKLK